MSNKPALFLSALLLLPGAVLAQDEGFTPSNEELDRDLDESLRREYQAPPPQTHTGRYDPNPDPSPPVVTDPGESGDADDEFELRLGGMAAHYFMRMQDVSISHREGANGGQEIELEEVFSLDDDIDLDDLDDDQDVWQHSQSYKVWFDIGKHVSLQGSFWRTVFRSQATAQQNVRFGNSSFAANQVLQTKLDVAVADFDVVVKPINNRYVSLDLHFGGRYIYWRTQVRRVNTSSQQDEQRTIEAGVPMVGLGITLRPAKEFQIFARGRIGYLSYERDAHWRVDDDGDIDYVERKERETTSGQAEAGILVMLGDTIGFTLGYRLDYIEMERDVDERRTHVEGLAHGAFAGAILEF
jgi:hypothetical protein